MKQAALELNFSLKETRKEEFQDQNEQVVLWGTLVELIASFYPVGRNGRPSSLLTTVLRIYFVQQWFTVFALSNLWIVRGKLMRDLISVRS